MFDKLTDWIAVVWQYCFVIGFLIAMLLVLVSMFIGAKEIVMFAL
jgi:hypothetical protein